MPFKPGQSGNPNRQFKPGKSGNPKGRKAGTKNWSTIIQKLLADEDFADNVINNKPSWWNNLPNKNLAEIIVATMAIKAAVYGDVAAATWLRVTGYGNTGKYIPKSDELEFTGKPSLKVIWSPEAKKVLTTIIP